MAEGQMTPGRCEAVCSTHGQQCRASASYLDSGLRVCGTHASSGAVHLPTGPQTLDEEGASEINDLLNKAMQHELWSATPGPIRQLIEHAWVRLWDMEAD